MVLVIGCSAVAPDLWAQEGGKPNQSLNLNNEALESEVKQRFEKESRPNGAWVIPLKGEASKLWIRYRGYQKKDFWNNRYSIIQKSREWELGQSLNFLLRVLKSEKDVLLQKTALEALAQIELFKGLKENEEYSVRFLASIQQNNQLPQEIKLIRLVQYKLSRLLADKDRSPGFRLEVSRALQSHLSQLLAFMAEPPDELSKRSREALTDGVLASWFGLKRVESRDHVDEFFLPVSEQISEISMAHENVLRDLIPSSVIQNSPDS